MDPTPLSAASPTNIAATPLAGDVIIGERQRWPFLPALALAWAGMTLVTAALSGAAIPKLLTILDPDAKESNLAVIAAVGGVVVMVVTPLFGRLSDRTRHRWGMRKPWIAGGLLVGTIGAAMLAMAGDVLSLALGWAVVQIGYGAVAMAAHTLLADQVPGRVRARVAAMVGVSGGIATVASAAIVAALPIESSWSWFIVPAAVSLVVVAPILVSYRDARRTTPAPPLSLAEVLSTYWLDPRRYRDFAWAWASRFFMTMSIVAISLYLFFLIIDTLGYSVEEAGGVQTTALACFFIGNIVATLIFGWLSDLLRRRKAIVWASGLVSAIGIAVLMMADDLPMFLIGITIVGFAQGAYISVDVALMTEVLPSMADAGKDLGIVALAYQLPQILGPIVAAGVIALAGGSYTGLFVFSLACSVLGGLLIGPVRSVR